MSSPFGTTETFEREPWQIIIIAIQRNGPQGKWRASSTVYDLRTSPPQLAGLNDDLGQFDTREEALYEGKAIMLRKLDSGQPPFV